MHSIAQYADSRACGGHRQSGRSRAPNFLNARQEFLYSGNPALEGLQGGGDALLSVAPINSSKVEDTLPDLRLPDEH